MAQKRGLFLTCSIRFAFEKASKWPFTIRSLRFQLNAAVLLLALLWEFFSRFSHEPVLANGRVSCGTGNSVVRPTTRAARPEELLMGACRNGVFLSHTAAGRALARR
jgi:hypothetical protein